jgi:hypothetical protein
MAKDYALTIGALLWQGVARSPEQTIVCDVCDALPETSGRRLGSGLTRLGVRRADTVAVMD